MRRRYSADSYRRLAEALRESRPGLTLSTDLIVGFPGETDEDFQATLALVRDVGFVDSFSFKYSPRPGTSAAEMDGVVPPEVALSRLAIAPRAASESRSRSPKTVTRMPFSESSARSDSTYSSRSAIKASTSCAGRAQFSCENA